MYTYTTIVIFSVFGLNPKERAKHYLITSDNKNKKDKNKD
jgi:hypothetical protein